MKISLIDWKDVLAIRHQVLWPEKSLEFCRVEGDEEALHYGAIVDLDNDERLVCVASIYRDGGRARLRKFATLPTFQGQGIGTSVLRRIFQDCREAGVQYFWCDARERAIGFYKQFGLVTEGGRFYKGEIPYFKMAVHW